MLLSHVFLLNDRFSYVTANKVYFKENRVCCLYMNSDVCVHATRFRLLVPLCYSLFCTLEVSHDISP